MRRSRLNVALYVGLIFASGVLVGVFGHRLYMVKTVIAKGTIAGARPEEWRKQYMTEMQRRLNLRHDQVSQLNAVLDETRTRFHEVHEKSRPEMESIKSQQQAKIRAILDEGQRTEYEKMRQERERNAPPRGRDGPGL